MSPHSGSKKSPSSEIIDLRKQVADLKDSALARRRVEDALREAESLHRATLDEAPAGIVRLDRMGRVLYANPAFFQSLGYHNRQDFQTIGELRGVFVNGEEARRIGQLAQGSPTFIVAKCLRRDGTLAEIGLRGAGSDAGATMIMVRQGEAE